MAEFARYSMTIYGRRYADGIELSALAREAEQGDAICTSFHVEPIDFGDVPDEAADFFFPNAVYCYDCGEPIVPDPAGSEGVWVHDPDLLGDRAFDLNELHAPRPYEATG